MLVDASQRPVSVYPDLKALAGFRLKPVLRREGLCPCAHASESRLNGVLIYSHAHGEFLYF